jgi:hypothetical protein
MDAFIQTLHKEIDTTTLAFQNEFGNLPLDLLNIKPNPDTWSIGQNIDHLIVINESYVPVLAKAHKGQLQVPFWGKLPVVYNFFGNFILKSSGPDRSKKIKTFPIWQPAQSEVSTDILTRFSEHQKKLKALISEAKPLLEKKTLITSPANDKITYTLEKAFEIIVAHEKRHLIQAKEVKDGLAAGSW